MSEPGLDSPHCACNGVLIPVEVLLSQPVPQVGYQVFVFLEVRSHIEHSAHIGVCLNRWVVVGDADVGGVSCSQQVVEHLYLSPARHRDELDNDIVVAQHALFDKVRVEVVLRGRASRVAAVVHFDCDVPGLNKSAIDDFRISRRRKDAERADCQ